MTFLPHDPRAIAAGQKGGAIRSQQAERQREHRWAEKFPQVPFQIKLAIFREGPEYERQLQRRIRRKQDA